MGLGQKSRELSWEQRRCCRNICKSGLRILELHFGDRLRTVATIAIDEKVAVAAALVRQQARIEAVPQNQVRSINLDITSLVGVVLGAVQRSAPYVARLTALPEYEIDLVNQLEDLTRALMHAHVLYGGSTVVAGPILAHAERASDLREQFWLDAQVMLRRKAIHPSALDDIKGGKGYRNMSHELLTLAAVIRKAWPQMQGKTSITEEELDEADSIGMLILQEFSDRDNAEAQTAEAALLRSRTYTLVLRAYDELRRGLAFLRHTEGDLETIAPSPYSGKKVRTREESSPTPEETFPKMGAIQSPEPIQDAPISKDGPFR